MLKQTPHSVWRYALVFLLLMAFWPKFSLAVSLSHDTLGKDNKHNMSSASSNYPAKTTALGGTDQICIFCHTPHSAAPESTLWSRPEPKTASFPLYGEPAGLPLAIKGSYGGNAQADSEYGIGLYPNGASRMCLSCHDGQTAINILRSNRNIAMIGDVDVYLANPSDLSLPQPVIDLSTSHPVSFKYTETVCRDINAALSGGTVNTCDGTAGDYQLPSALTTPLDGQQRMQCTTCHDPHDDTRLGGGAFADLPFWRSPNYLTACNSCHIDAVPTSVATGPVGDHQLP